MRSEHGVIAQRKEEMMRFELRVPLPYSFFPFSFFTHSPPLFAISQCSLRICGDWVFIEGDNQ
jgi:hypothetical protein